MKPLVAVLALALVAVAAPANAQGEPVGIALSVTSAGTVPALGSGEFAFNVTVGCAELLTNADADLVVEVMDPPAWMNATERTVELEVAGCLTSLGSTSAEGSIPFVVSEAAPAVVQHTVNLKATMGTTSSNEPSATYTVAYKSDYDLTAEVQFPLTVTNKTTSFKVTGVQASNAPSMIMVDDFSCDSAALISGIGPLQYANKAGAPDTKVYTVTFTAPKGEWQKATCTLKVYGHYNFDGMAGEPTDRKTLTYEFVNGGVKEQDGGGGDKKSPAPVGVLTALGLVGLAAILRRRDA